MILVFKLPGGGGSFPDSRDGPAFGEGGPFECDYIVSMPHVHLHFLTDDEEYEVRGYGLLEIVCHGCGAALMVRYDEGRTKRECLKVRDDWADRHVSCGARAARTVVGGTGTLPACLNYRSSVEAVDIRQQQRRGPRSEER